MSKRRTWVEATIAWAVSRVVATLAAVVAAQRHGRDLTDVLTAWDGTWYILAARHGYPSTLPTTHGHVAQSTIAFFPGYPLVIRALNWLLPGGDLVAAILANTALGLAATIAFALLVRRHWGSAAARRAAWVFASFPGAIVLSMAYSEGLMLAASAACLLLLSRRRWVGAGLAGAIATATRPSGVALIAACAWLAFDALRRRRDLRPLAAPVLTSAGIGGYFLYLWRHTGRIDAWLVTEREGWGQRNDAGQALIREVVDVMTRRATTVDDIVLAAGAVLTLVLFVWLVRVRPPAEVMVTAVVGSLLVVTGILGARPRLILGVFPLLIPPAVSLRKSAFMAWVLVGLAAGFFLFIHLDASFASGQAVLLSP